MKHGRLIWATAVGVIVGASTVAVLLLGTGARRHLVRNTRSVAKRAPARHWTLVSLGDSVTSGAGCHDCVSYPVLFGKETTAKTKIPVTVINLGVNGQTSSGLLSSLSDTSTAAKDVQKTDLVTITIGANDFNAALPAYQAGKCGGADGLGCFANTMSPLRTNLTAILKRVRTLRGRKPTAIRVTDYWNMFQDGAVAIREDGTAYQRDTTLLTVLVNGVIQDVCRAEHVKFVDLFVPFKGHVGDKDPTPLLASDGDHPSQAGNQEIADALAQAGYVPLLPSTKR
jgi:lysophospholipase L1-like esterase